MTGIVFAQWRKLIDDQIEKEWQTLVMQRFTFLADGRTKLELSNRIKAWLHDEIQAGRMVWEFSPFALAYAVQQIDEYVRQFRMEVLGEHG